MTKGQKKKFSCPKKGEKNVFENICINRVRHNTYYVMEITVTLYK
jgi:hypothetical protein